MDNELRSRLQEIKNEDVILLIFIILIIITYIANQHERNYFVNRVESSKKIYYYLQIIVFLSVVIINLYYIALSYQEVTNLPPNSSYKRRKYANLSLTASLVALVAGLIILYIAITDTEIDAEITL